MEEGKKEGETGKKKSSLKFLTTNSDRLTKNWAEFGFQWLWPVGELNVQLSALLLNKVFTFLKNLYFEGKTK